MQPACLNSISKREMFEKHLSPPHSVITLSVHGDGMTLEALLELQMRAAVAGLRPLPIRGS